MRPAEKDDLPDGPAGIDARPEESGPDSGEAEQTDAVFRQLDSGDSGEVGDGRDSVEPGENVTGAGIERGGTAATAGDEPPKEPPVEGAPPLEMPDPDEEGGGDTSAASAGVDDPALLQEPGQESKSPAEADSDGWDVEVMALDSSPRPEDQNFISCLIEVAQQKLARDLAGC